MTEIHAHPLPDGGIQVRTNLDRLDPCDLPMVFAALGNHLDLDGEELRKAVSGSTGSEPPDPRFPELITLANAARKDWDRFGAQLVTRIEQLLADGKILPLTATSEQLLREVLEDHKTAILIRFSGRPEGYPRLKRLVDAGLVRPPGDPSLAEVAYRLGRGVDATTPPPVAPKTPPPLEQVVRAALRVQLTVRDRAAMGFAQQRAAAFMRRPVDQAASTVDRALSMVELNAFRQATAEAVKGRQGAQELERALRDAAASVSEHHPARAMVREFGPKVVGPGIKAALAQGTLQNDMERVARTELAFAHSHGAVEALRAQTAALGITDPEVYKFCAPKACQECRRIWGPISSPHVYRLSFIEAREAKGGNFGLPAREWGPTIGPIHPRCACPPLSVYNKKLLTSINRAADAIMAAYERDE